MQQIVIGAIVFTILGSMFAGAGYASYAGYGLSTSAPEEGTASARSNSVRGIFILGGGPGSGK